jgi:hypothetical protein
MPHSYETTNKPIGKKELVIRNSAKSEKMEAMLSEMASCGPEQGVGGCIPETQQTISAHSPS